MYFTLYFFVFLHELAHLVAATLTGIRANRIHIFPWGCMLSLETVPTGKKSLFIFLSGPLFNLFMCFLNIYPTENLSLALFNLIPIMPLDGGVVASIIFGSFSYYIAIGFILLITLAAVYLKASLLLPILLTIFLFISEKNRLDASISAKVIGYFNAKK